MSWAVSVEHCLPYKSCSRRWRAYIERKHTQVYRQTAKNFNAVLIDCHSWACPKYHTFIQRNWLTAAVMLRQLSAPAWSALATTLSTLATPDLLYVGPISIVPLIFLKTFGSRTVSGPLNVSESGNKIRTCRSASPCWLQLWSVTMQFHFATGIVRHCRSKHRRRVDLSTYVLVCECLHMHTCLMIALITWNSNLVPLIKGLCSSNPGRFEFSGFVWGFWPESNRRPRDWQSIALTNWASFTSSLVNV